MPDECNCRIGPPGSFWGCAPSSPTRSLTQRIGVFQFPHHNLAEWRATDIVTRYRVTTQSVWKLNCGVLVGGQTIISAVRLQANAGPLKAGARQTVLRSGLQRYSRHSCGIRSGVTSTRHGAIELRCRAAFVTLQSEIRPEYSKEISPGPARSTPPRWPRRERLDLVGVNRTAYRTPERRHHPLSRLGRGTPHLSRCSLGR